MKSERAAFYEFAAGVLLVDIGFILWWWSTQLVWIEVYPPPLGKSLIESMPFVFWAIGAILIVDGLSRWVRNNRATLPPKSEHQTNQQNWKLEKRRVGVAGDISTRREFESYVVLLTSKSVF